MDFPLNGGEQRGFLHGPLLERKRKFKVYASDLTADAPLIFVVSGMFSRTKKTPTAMRLPAIFANQTLRRHFAKACATKRLTSGDFAPTVTAASAQAGRAPVSRRSHSRAPRAAVGH
jgi:hypothetical protein